MDFSRAACSIRAAAVYVILALLVSTSFEFTSSKGRPGSTTSEHKSSKKGPSKKKKTKQPKETDMKTLNMLKFRVKVGGVKLVLALAGVRLLPSQ